VRHRASSKDNTAGIQYCRINSPIVVAGPIRVSSSRSSAVVIASSSCTPLEYSHGLLDVISALDVAAPRFLRAAPGRA
jgi:hypothetical protein